ncbi:hypothetical protein [Paraburkholderia sp. C35]|uniref:hypothetical protein n=1 Tax=Paraburkholderia sp. C35 TaxID=2126993 RepID=UPI0019514E95|nr:hypothetical protein [Paraburkholderia sp. C35]
MKPAGSRSLREQVQKWLAPNATASVRVVRYGRLHRSKTRYVVVETEAISGPRSMYFFLHADGSWNVFPPAAARWVRPELAGEPGKTQEDALHAVPGG